MGIGKPMFKKKPTDIQWAKALYTQLGVSSSGITN